VKALSSNRLRAWLACHRLQLQFSLRVTLAGAIAYAVSEIAGVQLHGLWIVLTALIVSQVTLSGSLQSTIEFIIGTLGGAVYAGLLGLFFPAGRGLGETFVVALAIAPTAFFGALDSRFRAAPFSAVLVLLVAGLLGTGPLASAFYRLLEVTVGCGIALAVSLLVLPERAQKRALPAAAKILENLAALLPAEAAGFTRQLDAAEMARRRDEIRNAVAALRATVAEARNERIVTFVSEPDAASLSRTVERLSNDLIMIGRAATAPLPEGFAQRLGPPLAGLATATGEFLRGCACGTAQHRADRPAYERGGRAHLRPRLRPGTDGSESRRSHPMRERNRAKAPQRVRAVQVDFSLLSRAANTSFAAARPFRAAGKPA
jgi:uncharacterized membrane protein YgaE (UPF0421/DUF939 family)